MTTISGIPVDPITGEPKDERGLLALQKQEEEEQEESGFDPMSMAALQAGASLLRHSGPRYTPMSFGQAIGHAIPAGIQGYYQQDALNQQEQQAMLERQQAEQQALQDKQQAEADEKIERDRRTEFEAMLIESGLSREVQRRYMSIYNTNPLKAHELLDKRLAEKKEKGPKHKYKLVTEEEKKTLGLPPDVYQKVTPQDGDVPFYIDKMGTKLAMPVEEETKEGIKFVKIPGSNDLILTDSGEYKAQIKIPAPEEEVTVDMVQGVYDALVEVDPANEVQYGEMMDTIQTGTPTKDVHSALFEKLKAFEQGETPEVIDYEGVSKNIFDKLIAGKDAQGRPLVTPLKLEGIMELPAEEKFNALKDVLNSIDTNAYKKFVSEGGLKVRQASLDQTKSEYDNEQEKYKRREQIRVDNERRKMNWGESRLQMEEDMHGRKIRQMDKNWEDAQIGNLVPAEKWISEFGGELPKDVAFVERKADGTRGRLIKNDWTNYVEELNNDAKVEITDEIDRLFKKYGDKYTKEDRDEIKGLLFDKDPMNALKKAHAKLHDKGEKLIQAPASILKKYQSDMGVRRAAQEALAMMNDPEQMKIIENEVGFAYGQVTEKFKHPLFQKFKAIATMAALTKRHELIGSQMTDGELKFTEPLFPSDKDTKNSLRIKLETLIKDSEYNIGLTRGMFSREAGYNDAVWNYDANKWWSGGNDPTATSMEDIIEEAGEARGQQGGPNKPFTAESIEE